MFEKGSLTILEDNRDKKIRKFTQIEEWKVVKIYESGKQKRTPFCQTAIQYPNRLLLHLDKKALPELERSLSLAKKQNKPFKGRGYPLRWIKTCLERF